MHLVDHHRLGSARLGGTVLRLKYAGSKAYTRSSLLCSSSYEVEATL